MGSVYRARHVKLGHEVAIKMLLPQFVEDPTIVPRFEREARALASLSHPNIVTLIDYSVTEGRPYLVMEMLDGETLDSVIERGALTDEVARYVAMQVADALSYAHGIGFVHRDLKPANIFLVKLPTDDFHVKILDFGFVKLIADDRPGEAVLTQTGIAFGTPYYMSPEQATGDSTDARTDIYAFGIILFEMLAGRRPFVGSLPEIIRQHLTAPLPSLADVGAPCVETAELAALLARATAKEKSERFQSADELREALVALPHPMVHAMPVTGDAPTLFGAAAEAASRSIRALTNPKMGAPASSQSVANATFKARPGTPKGVPLDATQAAPAPRSSWKRWVAGLGVIGAFGGALLWFSGKEDSAKPGAAGASAHSPPTAAPHATKPDKTAKGKVKAPPTEKVTGTAEAAGAAAKAAAGSAANAAADSAEAATEAAKKLADRSSGVVDSLVGSISDTVKGARDTLGGAPSAPAPCCGPDPWKERPSDALLDGARATVLERKPLATPTEKALRAFAQKHKGDPRPHLVIAQGFLARQQLEFAAQRYDLAYRVDTTAKGDPRMLADLLDLASDGPARASAAKAVAHAYGKEAIPTIDARLADSSLPPAKAEALKKLRDQLENPTAVVAPAPAKKVTKAPPPKKSAKAGKAKSKKKGGKKRHKRR